MRLLLGMLIALTVAAVLGLGATYLSVSGQPPFGTLQVGAWQAWPRSGTATIDPYAQAVLIRSGALPVGSGDGVAFVTRRTDDVEPLNARCETVVRGITPAARYWTLTVYDEAGRLMNPPELRQGFTSQEIVRNAAGEFEIVVSPRARAGNWLPVARAGRYMLVLRLYDTPIGITTPSGPGTPMPAVIQRGCPA
ncbi:MAG TPA: DUF1214 domain-containing protein [Xanthobacteraceae bacterium]|nr:DUF1214 domain-containing protein [Xanthobacteraceae bacterium]